MRCFSFIFLIISALTSQSALSQTDTSCLISYYKMNGNALDAGALANHCEVNGAILTTDRYGNEDSAYYFNGNASLFTAFDSRNYKEITVTAWIKTSYRDKQETIVQPASTVLYVNRFNAGRYFAAFDANSWNNSPAEQSATDVANGQWKFIAASTDGSFTRIYVNGKLENTFQETYVPNLGQLTIGNQVNGLWGFIGSIDDLRIYSCALSPETVKSIFDDANYHGNEDDFSSKNNTCTSEELLVSPNPSQGKIFIKQQFKKEANIIIIDPAGRLIYARHISKIDPATEINMHFCKPGIYLIQIQTADRICTQKFILQ